MEWVDSLKEATGMMRLQELNRAAEGRTLGITHSQSPRVEVTQQHMAA